VKKLTLVVASVLSLALLSGCGITNALKDAIATAVETAVPSDVPETTTKPSPEKRTLTPKTKPTDEETVDNDEVLTFEDSEGFVKVKLSGGKAEIEYDVKKWDERYGSVEFAAEYFELEELKPGPFRVNSFGKAAVRDICIGKIDSLESAVRYEPSIMFLMSNGRVEYLKADLVYSNYAEEYIYTDEILWLEDIVSISYENDNEGIGQNTIYATDKNGARHDTSLAYMMRYVVSGNWTATLLDDENGEPLFTADFSFEPDGFCSFEISHVEKDLKAGYYGSYEIITAENHESGCRPGSVLFDLGLNWINDTEGLFDDLPEEIECTYMSSMSGSFEMGLWENGDGRLFSFDGKYKDNLTLTYDFDYGDDSSSDDGILGYLAGYWEFYLQGNLNCDLSVYWDSSFLLSFYNLWHEEVNTLSGTILSESDGNEFLNSSPVITLDFEDESISSEGFFVWEETVHEGRAIMSLLPLSDEPSVFDGISEPLMFAKETDDFVEESLRKSAAFPATFWGADINGAYIWLDAMEYDDVYEEYFNSEKGTACYPLESEPDYSEFDGAHMSDWIWVETNENGEVVSFNFSSNDEFDTDLEFQELSEFVFGIINDTDAVKYYLEMGMTPLFTGETEVVQGEICYLIALGTDHEEHFVREVFFALNPVTLQVYEYDIINDIWEAVAMG